MKVNNRLKMFAVLAGVLMLSALPIVSQSLKEQEPVPYLIISPHTEEECLGALDAILAQPNGEEQLEAWDWGCMVGDHTGYLMTTAKSDAEALKLVPENLRKAAKAIKLNKFTPEQIKSFHEQSK